MTTRPFVSLNLAHLLAESGARVLIVDGDLRKGRLHRDLGVERAPGLSDLIRGSADLSDVVRQLSDNLFFVATGEIASHPSELLGSSHYPAVLGELSKQFDVVLVDTAPVLAVTDAILAAQSAGTTLLVVRAGHHHLRELVMTAKRMWQNGVQPHARRQRRIAPLG